MPKDSQHNKPPEPVTLATGDELTAEVQAALGREQNRSVEAGEVTGSGGPKPPGNETEAKLMVATIKSIQVTLKQADDKVKALKNPYQDANKLVSAIGDDIAINLKGYKEKALKLVSAWLEINGEDTITSDYGNTASFRETQDLEIDLDELPTEYQKIVPDEKAIKAALKEGKGVRGVTIKTNRNLVVS